MTDDRPAILCGDIGGTHSRFAIACQDGKRIEIRHRQQFEDATADSLQALLHRYLSSVPAPTRACLAVAGPTDGRTVAMTNLPWRIDADELGREFGFPFRLINDFEAVAWGIDALEPEHCRTMQEGAAAEHAPRLALGPGTGLGVALCAWTGAGYRPLPGEGGHIGFAPADARQSALLRHLQGKFGRVSVERILSGQGIADLYAFCAPGGAALDAAAVTQAAMAGGDPAAAEAMQLFCRILGQTAGDLALAGGARGGVYLAGGIPPRILPLLADGELLAGFRDKGRFSGWIGAVPFKVVTDPDIGLKGAALAR